MIPITLTIQGLYSYKESQKIDFQALTSSGIFGIFGAVGSGKSSILEAIMFVLFEKSDRLNIKNDNRYYNMLNLQSDELMIDFVFFAGSNNADKFRFRFVARRNKKDFEKVEPKESNRYKWVDEEWLPLDQVKDAAEILGMSYENFMQTIIIPQGKFREFVDRSAVERTKMLKELFHLDRFDLSEKTNKLISNNKQEIDRLEGKLEGLGEVDQKDIDEGLKLLQDKQSILEKQQVMCRLKKSEEQNLQRYRKIFSDIRVLELNKKQLDEKKEYFESKERLVQLYEKAFTYLKVKILIREGLKSELQKADAKKEELQIKLLQNEEKLFVQKEKLQSTKEAYLNRHKITEQCEDLENIIGIKAQNDKIEKLNIKIKKEKDKYAEEESSVAGLQNTFLAKEVELEQLEKDIPDHSEVHQVYHWKKRCKELQVELENQQKQLNKYIQKLENVETEKSKFFSNGKSSLSFESISTLLNNELEQYEVKKTSLYKDLQHLVVQQKLADLSINLKEGEACPLCGSSNHPAVLVQNDVLHVVEQKENELNEVAALQDKIRKYQGVLQKLQQEFKHHNTLAQEQEKIIKAVLEKTENHEQDFIWVNYKNVTEDQLTSRIKLAEVQKNKILALKKELKILKDEVSHKDDQLKKLNEILNKLESELYAGQAVRDSRKGQLKQLKIEKFEHFSVDQLKESLQRGRNQLQEVEDNYEKAVEY
ncbi:MAG: SMC family ATPase, partial [Bacteroidota bacterium]|nr:SMC family ATPase [Bacteroidota bacterium]